MKMNVCLAALWGIANLIKRMGFLARKAVFNINTTLTTTRLFGSRKDRYSFFDNLKDLTKQNDTCPFFTCGAYKPKTGFSAAEKLILAV